jgi:hypothetical protein
MNSEPYKFDLERVKKGASEIIASDLKQAIAALNKDIAMIYKEGERSHRSNVMQHRLDVYEFACVGLSTLAWIEKH